MTGGHGFHVAIFRERVKPEGREAHPEEAR
jgi:hypothetical protein